MSGKKFKTSSVLGVRQKRRVVQLKDIKNKAKRKQVWAKRKLEVAKTKSKLYQRRRAKRLKHGFKAAPFETKTQESKRVPDETTITGYDEEVEGEHQMDEFSPHFSQLTRPKTCITTSARPMKRTFELVSELLDVFPDAKYCSRRNLPIKAMIAQAIKRKYTGIIVVFDDKSFNGAKGYCRGPHKLLHVALPNGPTAFYRLTNIKLRKEIFHGSTSTPHRPELILSNFSTKLGVRLGRMLATLFDQKAEFRGRQVATFRNQRDFVFFRRHRYMFYEEGDNVEIQELGPRFTLKLVYLHQGLFDPDHAEYEWKWHEDMGLEKLKWFN